MRAEYVSNLGNIDVDEIIVLEKNHHLLNVARIREGGLITLFDGKGLQSLGIIKEINRENISVCIQSKEMKIRPHHIDVAIGTCKREACELIMKMAVELGVNRLIPLKTEFSQKIFLKKERQERLLISALKQSNAFWIPEVTTLSSFDDFNFSYYDNIFYFNLQRGNSMPQKKKRDTKSLILIGPEGGLAPREEESLLQYSNLFLVHFPTYILRTTTAMPTAMGRIFALLGQC